MTNQHTEYRPVEGFPGYRVGLDATVWSRRKRGPGNKLLAEWHRLAISLDSNGYPCVCLYRHGLPSTRLIHRLMLEAFVGPCPSGMEACHFNDVKADNRIENLRWGTRRENAADCARNGNARIGSRNPRSVLRKEDIQIIRNRLIRGDTQRSVAADFGVSQHAIFMVKIGRTWSHVA